MTSVCPSVWLMPISCPHTQHTHFLSLSLLGSSLGLMKQLVAGMHRMTWHIPSDFNALKLTAYCWARHSAEGNSLVIWKVFCVSQGSRLDRIMCVSQSKIAFITLPVLGVMLCLSFSYDITLSFPLAFILFIFLQVHQKKMNIVKKYFFIVTFQKVKLSYILDSLHVK